MFNKIAVLGTGTMGQGIAQFFAWHQLLVTAYDINKKMLSKAQKRLKEQEGLGKHLSFTSDIKEAISDADLIIEIVTEDLEIKRRLYFDIGTFLKKDSKGFIANRLQAAVLREACFLVESGG